MTFFSSWWNSKSKKSKNGEVELLTTKLNQLVEENMMLKDKLYNQTETAEENLRILNDIQAATYENEASELDMRLSEIDNEVHNQAREIEQLKYNLYNNREKKINLENIKMAELKKIEEYRNDSISEETDDRFCVICGRLTVEAEQENQRCLQEKQTILTKLNESMSKILERIEELKSDIKETK